MVCLPVAVNTRAAGGVAWHGVHTFRWSSPVALNQGGGAAFAWGERAGACNTDPLGSLAPVDAKKGAPLLLIAIPARAHAGLDLLAAVKWSRSPKLRRWRPCQTPFKSRTPQATSAPRLGAYERLPPTLTRSPSISRTWRRVSATFAIASAISRPR